VWDLAVGLRGFFYTSSVSGLTDTWPNFPAWLGKARKFGKLTKRISFYFSPLISFKTNFAPGWNILRIGGFTPKEQNIEL
jgi:hypothetical protein